MICCYFLWASGNSIVFGGLDLSFWLGFWIFLLVTLNEIFATGVFSLSRGGLIYALAGGFVGLLIYGVSLAGSCVNKEGWLFPKKLLELLV